MQHIPSSRIVQAGALRAEYHHGTLRYLKSGNTELLRIIYFALRDAQWATIPLIISSQDIQTTAEGFTVRYRAQNQRGGSAIIDWKCVLSCSPEGKVEFKIRGTFREKFRSRRAGFCVLHPLENTTGLPFTVTTPAGETIVYQFPQYIAPHQPAKDIRTMHWTTKNSIECTLAFTGDTFEMEDQRNWTDASYKTYCTPLDRPAPVTYQPGDVVEQSVVFQVLSSADSSATDEQVRVGWKSKETFPWPSVGTCIPLILGDVNPASADLLRKLLLNSLRADLLWGGPGWEQQWQELQTFAQHFGKPLHLVLHHKEGDFNQLLTKLAQNTASTILEAISVVRTKHAVASVTFYQELTPLLRRQFPNVKVGIGTAYYFTLLNRARPDLALADFTYYANSAQVHAFDEASIVETIAGQAETVNSARQFVGECPIRVSPVGLNARFNPDAAVLDADQLTYPFPPDPRQDTQFAAGWMVGCLNALAQAGAAHVDLFELIGTRGIVNKGQPSPAYHVLRRILDQKPEQLLKTESSNPLAISNLGIITSSNRLLYVVNHLSVPVVVFLDLNVSWSITWQLAPSQLETEPGSSTENSFTLLLSPYNCLELREVSL